jgi:arginyl-tRNA synthetase
MRQLEERGLAHDRNHGLASLGKLTEPQEQQLVKRLCAFPETVRQCAVLRAPHTMVHYLRDLANDFHTYYSAHQFIVEDHALRDARLVLALATQTVIRNGLKLLGVSAPVTM